MAAVPLRRAPRAAYVKNKAGLTGQTVPGRRIPGHWPYPGPEELAETEPCVPGLIDVPFFVSFNTPHERVLAKLGRHGRTKTNFSMPTDVAASVWALASAARLSCSVLHEPLVVRRKARGKAARGLEA